MGIVEHRSGWRLALALLALPGCAADQVGVVLPRGGVQAIESADLRWDLWRITDPRLGGRAPGSSGARRIAKRISSRLAEAGFGPGWLNGHQRQQTTGEVGPICGQKEGVTDEVIVVAALDPGIGTLSAVPIAGLLGLSRAFDAPSPSTHTMVFCVLPEAGGIANYARDPVAPLSATRAFFVVGSLTGKKLLVEEGVQVAGFEPILLHTGPISARIGDDMGRVRFSAVEARTRVAYLALSAAE